MIPEKHTRRLPGITARLLLIALAVSNAPAALSQTQMPDARVLPRGTLRLTFEPHYTNYDQRFAKNSPGVEDGSTEPLGTDLSADSAGANIFNLLPAETSIGSLSANPAYRINIGSLLTDMDADIRRFPFEVSIGLTDRLTVRAEVPIVTARMNAVVAFDSTDANVGWNQAAAEAGNLAAFNSITTLIGELSAAVSQVTGLIDQGAFGCPSSQQCTDASALVDRASQLALGLGVITGVGQSGRVMPPVAPLQTSVAGVALTSEIQDVASQLVALGVVPFTGSLPLPADRLSTSDIDAILAGPNFGYELFPLTTIKMSRLGDVEIGLRYQLFDSPQVRTVLSTTLRLPTSTRDRVNNAIDLGTGDRQTDVEAGFEFVFVSTSRLGITVAANYTAQFADELPRRVTPPDMPLSLVTSEAVVQRNLGDMFRVSAFPWMALSDGFTVYASASYYRKNSDTYTGPRQLTVLPTLDPSLLALESSQTSVTFGGGIAYRGTRSGASADTELPIEAGVSYRSVFSGSGGLTPKFNTLNIYLKLYYRLFGDPN